MNTLLIFFAFPIAVIIFSIILERLLNNPIAVASLIFAIFLIVTFAAFDENFLIATLAYTIISFITALIVHFFRDRDEEHNICEVLRDLLQNNNSTNNTEDDETACNTISDLLGNSSNNNENNNCNCICNRRRNR